MYIKSAILFVVLILSSSVAGAQCLEGNCIDGVGTYQYKTGSTYVGEFRLGVRNGHGSLFYRDGSKYQGDWKNDQPNGFGVEYMPDGSSRAGEWQKGRYVGALASAEGLAEKGGTVLRDQKGCVSGDCMNGKGIYIHQSGAIYVGDFADGEVHGNGVCFYEDGSKYQGEWRHRFPEGTGTKSYPDGRQISGQWKKGQPLDDMGRLVASYFQREDYEETVDVQFGCLMGNCENGEGTYAYPDGSKYEGFFVNGKPSLRGTFYYPNGERYVGGFKNGLPDGDGKLYRLGGEIRTGQWVAGEWTGAADVFVSAQPTAGCVSGNCDNGMGTYRFKNGDRYEGYFLNGLPHGKGKVSYTNGEYYEGDFERGYFNGIGTLHMNERSPVHGQWKDGVYIGPEKTDPLPLPTPAISARPTNELKIWAVIIGVADYKHMPVLRYTDDDAYRMYAFLKSPEGGALSDEQIMVLVDEEATKENILKKMNYVFSKAGPNDLVMLYYSGHGLKGSFLPIDFDGYNNKLLHTEINNIMEKSRAKYKLLLADACYSGSLFTMRSAEVPDAINTYYSTLAEAGSGTALIMSSKSEETSLESSEVRQGVFTHFLIRGLKGEADNDANKVITIDELFGFVYGNVRTYSGNRQSPVIKGDYDKKMTVAVIR